PTLVLHLLEQRRFAQLQADPHRYAEQHDRQQERHAPVGRLERLGADMAAHAQDHQQRQEQAERGGGLDEAGVQAALAVWRVLGDVGRRAAVFAAEREPLQQSQRDQDHWRGDADARVTRQQADQEGRRAHDHDGDQEGVLAPDQVAESAEHQRAERPHRETGGEGEQGEDEGAGFIQATEELLGDDRGERTVQVEVVPLEYGAQRRGEDHFLVTLREHACGRGDGRGGHRRFPLAWTGPRVPRPRNDCRRNDPPDGAGRCGTIGRTLPDALRRSRTAMSQAVYPVRAGFAAGARITRAQYEQSYIASVAQPDAFWGRVAERIDWFRPPTQVKDVSYQLDDFHIRWYADGELNASVNCLDRHLATRGDKTALVFERDDPTQPAQHVSYRDLHARVCRLANALRALGVAKGDVVTIYLPMIPEAAVAML